MAARSATVSAPCRSGLRLLRRLLQHELRLPGRVLDWPMCGYFWNSPCNGMCSALIECGASSDQEHDPTSESLESYSLTPVVGDLCRCLASGMLLGSRALTVGAAPSWLAVAVLCSLSGRSRSVARRSPAVAYAEATRSISIRADYRVAASNGFPLLSILVRCVSGVEARSWLAIVADLAETADAQVILVTADGCRTKSGCSRWSWASIRRRSSNPISGLLRLRQVPAIVVADDQAGS